MADSPEREGSEGSELRRRVAELGEEVAELRRLIEEHLGEPGPAPVGLSLPPGFKLSGNRFRKASALREELFDALVECGWNKSEVARRLGITRVSVWRRMKQLGLPLEPPVDEGKRVQAPGPQADASEEGEPIDEDFAEPGRSESFDASWD